MCFSCAQQTRTPFQLETQSSQILHALANKEDKEAAIEKLQTMFETLNRKTDHQWIDQNVVGMHQSFSSIRFLWWGGWGMILCLVLARIEHMERELTETLSFKVLRTG